jgi:hypothetical protein
MQMLSHSLEVATKGRKNKAQIEARTALLFGALCEAGYFIGRAAKPREAMASIWAELETLIDALLVV